VSLERLWAGWRLPYLEAAVGPPSDACVFCGLLSSDEGAQHIVAREELVFTVVNAFPYTSGHVIVAPTRHVGDLEGLDTAELTALMAMTRQAVVALKAAYRPDGINLGANLGRAAGAGIPGHLHLHALPRWTGDTNFLTTVAEARVLPEPLSDTARRVRAAWPSEGPA
jgi:diadenosine tetraphosphate (Ap4A) HIT family hydrolase